MDHSGALKSDRLLRIYLELERGVILGKKELAQKFHVTERSIQRDISALRCFLAEQNRQQDIIYDKRARGYFLIDREPCALSNSEILAVCKILLESRSMRREEMLPILDKLIACCVPEQNKKAVHDLIANEKYHYLEPHHGKFLLDGLWEIGQAIQQHQVMEIQYERLKEPRLVTRRIEPVGILFSEYYFYLTAFLKDVDKTTEFENANDRFPTIYRIDRIRSFQILNEHFCVPYKDRFEEGEFRKRIQFMYGGKLERIHFRYMGLSLEAVLDRLPTARVTRQDEEGFVIEAEVFGKGVEMWLRSQGSQVVMIRGDL
ncbi:MAG: WYL domain-containing protein [Lachnospiraceae bacterium]|nr:WYL domain-containing protein [Lachnospiraceae bacterium]